MSKKPGSSTVIYMGLIPFEWDEDAVKSVVCGTGSVVDVRLGFDHVGKNKGFCFIEYSSLSEASRAMLLLEQMKIVNPQTNQIKKVRVDLSKESLKGNQDNQYRQPMMLTFSHLPDNVILPREQYAMGPPLPVTNFSLNVNASNLFLPNAPHQLPPVPQQQQYGYNNGYNNASNNNSNYNNNNNNNSSNNNNTNNNVNITSINSYLNSVNTHSNGLGPEFTQASQRLPPQPENLPFDVLGAINKTLSQIPPGLLIEFIANLKNIINGPSSDQAANVLLLSPELASSTAQALILMGFIDELVIKEAFEQVNNVTSASNTPVPPHQNALPQQPQQNYNGYPGSNPGYGSAPGYSQQQPPVNPNWGQYPHRQN